MNLTELARTLHISPQELRQVLQQAGFDIGQKAVKIDKGIAKKIIKNWSEIRYKYQIYLEEQKKEEEIKRKEAFKERKTLNIPKYVVVRDLANLANIPVSIVLGELMRNGVFVSMNEKIDFDTASVIGQDLNLELVLNEGDITKEAENQKEKIDRIIKSQAEGTLLERAPVIVVMGHVDHGKTKLLDSIRTTDVVAGEAGGITQHIGAYQIVRKGRALTFIDTPGHEAFTAMRSRGAKIADIAILVVAADDGVKPQTVEAYRIIEAAKIPFVVAMNKVDKADANIDKTKQELSTQLNIIPEDWGGKTICAPVSALTGAGIEDLLDMLLLTADTELDNMKANPNTSAVGTVVESKIDKGAGPVATILIQNGTLHLGDSLCTNGIFIGRAKAFKDYRGEDTDTAGPSTPVKILGLKISPEVGDIIEVGDGKKVNLNRLKMNKKDSSFEKSAETNENDKVAKLNIIIKADVLGSVEAIEESLLKINTDKAVVKIISKGLGNISETDIKRAEDSTGQILGFNIRHNPATDSLIRERGIKVKMFSVIYDLIRYVREELLTLMEPDYIRKNLGELKVLAVFKTESATQIIGGKVVSGKIEKDGLLEVVRNNQILAKGKILKLQAAKQDVSSIDEGQEGGIQFEGKPVIQVGDILRCYREEAQTIKL
jgi:translation initiation factor IF-2